MLHLSSEVHCWIHKKINITNLLERLNLWQWEGEEWIVNLIQETRMGVNEEINSEKVGVYPFFYPILFSLFSFLDFFPILCLLCLLSPIRTSSKSIDHLCRSTKMSSKRPANWLYTQLGVAIACLDWGTLATTTWQQPKPDQPHRWWLLIDYFLNHYPTFPYSWSWEDSSEVCSLIFNACITLHIQVP